MGEEVRITDYYVGGGGHGGGGGGEEEDDDRVMEWEAGLPNVDDLTPLSQSLISPELLSAFSISPEPYRSMTDVNRASQNTLSNMRDASEKNKHPSSAEKFTGLNSFSDDKGGEEMVLEEEGEEETADLTLDGSEMRKLRRLDSGDDGAGAGAGCGEEAESESGLLADDSSARTSSKRPRLVWTPQLHKRFVDVVAHLGVKNAVPKTIMNLMNVEGLTRENVASHLQKYRLYLKRMQGLSSQGPSSSDHLFASTPIPQEFGGGNGGNGNGGHRYGPPASYPAQMVHMPYPSPQIVPNGGGGGGYGFGYESNSYPYNNVSMQQQRDWSGNKFGSVSSYQQHRMTPNDK